MPDELESTLILLSDGVRTAKLLLQLRLVENILPCDGDGDYKTLRNVVEAQFLGRADSDLFHSILTSMDEVWKVVKSDMDYRLEYAEVIKNFRKNISTLGFDNDEKIIAFICDKLNGVIKVDEA